MKIYVDLILFLNFSFDFLLLITTSLLLKRRTRLIRIILGGLFGSLSTLLLFFKISSFTLFIIKIFISILMVIIAFKFKNLVYTFKNLVHLYLNSIILGGFLYLLNVEFSYKQVGLIFYHNGLSINFIVLIFSSPIILLLYYKEITKLKIKRKMTYKVKIKYYDKIYNLNGYLDTGNNLVSPYSNKSIVILNKDIIKPREFFYVPLHTISGIDMLKCIKVDDFIIEDSFVNKNNILVALSNNYLKLDGIDLLLNVKLMEG